MQCANYSASLRKKRDSNGNCCQLLCSFKWNKNLHISFRLNATDKRCRLCIILKSSSNHVVYHWSISQLLKKPKQNNIANFFIKNHENNKTKPRRTWHVKSNGRQRYLMENDGCDNWTPNHQLGTIMTSTATASHSSVF